MSDARAQRPVCPDTDAPSVLGSLRGFTAGQWLRTPSPEEMRASCDEWILMEAMDAPFAPGEPFRLPLGDGRYTILLDLLQPRWPWPVPVAGLAEGVVVVLREWVEGPGEPKLIRGLCALPAWEPAVRLAQSLRHHVQAEYGTEPQAALYERLLFRCGVPATPSTARFLLYTIAPDLYARWFPDSEPAPTRGIRITSLGLLPNPLDSSEWAHAQMAQTLTRTLPGATVRLMRDATSVARQHEAWWAEVSAAIAPVPRLDGRAANRRAPDEVTPLADQWAAGELTAEQVTAEVWRRHCERDPASRCPQQRQRCERSVARRLRRRGSRP